MQSVDRVVLVAPPRALGALRELLPTTVKERIAGELNQDLVKHPTDSVPARLESSAFV